MGSVCRWKQAKDTRMLRSIMAAPTLASLPSELQSSIVSWVLRPDHLANICLVSKQFYDVAMPMLYRDMTFNVDHWEQEHLDRFLCFGHRGHNFIRCLDIDSDEIQSENVALKIAKDALQVMPRNSLRSFRYVPTQVQRSNSGSLNEYTD